MYFCYIDESGNTGQNLKDVHQPFLVLTALIVKPEDIRSVENDIRTLGYSLFSAESRNTDFEFHGNDIYNAKGRYFKKLDQKKRFEVFDSLIDITNKHDVLRVGYICMDKSKYYGRLHIQQSAFHLLIENIEERLQGYLNGYGLLIADEQDELQQLLIDDLDHFKQHGTTFGYKSISIEKIIDSVHFVQSHNNYLMQLTDVICYIIRKGKEAQRKLFDEWEAYKVTETEHLTFSDWVEQFGHKGHRYFYQAYHRLTFKKAWIFAKDFPNR